jgi:hypothetical protein
MTTLEEYDDIVEFYEEHPDVVEVTKAYGAFAVRVDSEIQLTGLSEDLERRGLRAAFVNWDEQRVYLVPFDEEVNDGSS